MEGGDGTCAGDDASLKKTGDRDWAFVLEKSRNSALRTCAVSRAYAGFSACGTLARRVSVRRAAWCTAALSFQMAVARVTTEVLVGAHQVTVYGCVNTACQRWYPARAAAGPHAALVDSRRQRSSSLTPPPLNAGCPEPRTCPLACASAAPCLPSAVRPSQRRAKRLASLCPGAHQMRAPPRTGHGWRVDVYPGGYDTTCAGYLSLCLELVASGGESEDDAAPCARYELALCDTTIPGGQGGGPHHLVVASPPDGPPTAVRRGCVCAVAYSSP